MNRDCLNGIPYECGDGKYMNNEAQCLVCPNEMIPSPDQKSCIEKPLNITPIIITIGVAVLMCSVLACWCNNQSKQRHLREEERQAEVNAGHEQERQMLR